MKKTIKRLVALFLCAAVAVGAVPTLADGLVYFPEFHENIGVGMELDKAWPAIGSSAVPTQTYFQANDDWENCLWLAEKYIDLLVETGDFEVVSSFDVVKGKAGSDSVGYSAHLRYIGSAAMNGTLKATRAGMQWGDDGEYHLEVRAEREASRPNAARRNSVTVRWDSALRPDGIDHYAEPAPGSGKTDADFEETDTGSGQTDAGSNRTNTENKVGNSDNTFQDLGSAMGYYLSQEDGTSVATFEDKSKNPVSYEDLLQFAQEYVDLLVGEDNFYLVSSFDDNDYGGTKTCYIRYTGTALMEENLAAGDSIGWFHYSPYHIKVSVTQTDIEDYRYITVMWDKGLKPVESNRRTASGARLGSAERPPEAVTVVLGIGYNKMCVNGNVVQVDDKNAGVYPIAEDNRTLVPVSRIVDAFGGKSTWDSTTNNTTYTLGNYKVSHVIGSKDVLIQKGSQVQKKTMEVPSKAINNRTYVPVRYVLEGLGLWVGYEPNYKLVVVSNADQTGEDLVKLEQSQRLFASEEVPEIPRKTVEHYAIDDFNYIMEVGEALTLYNPRSAISGFSAYSWDVLEGGELVKVDRNQATCRFYAKRPGVVTLQSHMDETIVNYFGGSTHNRVTYTMTITITAATAQGSNGGLMKWQTCPACKGSGKIKVGTRQETCPTCLGQRQVLLP